MSVGHIWSSVFVAAIVSCGGGRIEVGSRDGGGGSSGAGSTGGASSGSSSPGVPTASSAGPGQAWTDAGPPPQLTCDTLGQRRDPMPSENAQYCVCEQVTRQEGGQTTTWLAWGCYGPPPGSPAPNPSCTYQDFTPGSSGACWIDWASCSDGQTYELQCANRFCICLVQGRRTPVQIEPRDTCPPDKASLNMLCGWNLQ